MKTLIFLFLSLSTFNTALWDDSKYIHYSNNNGMHIHFYKKTYDIYILGREYNSALIDHYTPSEKFSYSRGKYEIRKNIITCKDDETPQTFKFKIIDNDKTLKVILGNDLFKKSEKLDNN